MTTVASAHTAPLTKREEIAEVDVETPLGEKKEAAEDNAKKWLEREFGGFVPHCWCDLRRRRVVGRQRQAR